MRRRTSSRREPRGQQPHARRGARTLPAARHRVLPGRTGPDRRGHHVPLGDHGQVPLRQPRRLDVHRPVSPAGQRDPPEQAPAERGGLRRRPDQPARPGREQRTAGHRGLRVLAHRRGPAPVHRSRGRRRLLLLRPGDVRRAPHLRLLRPARPEGRVRVLGDRAARLAGGLEHGAGPARARLSGAGRAVAVPSYPVMSSYITFIGAGPYHVVRDQHDGIPLGIYCRQSLAPFLDPDEIFEVTRRGFDFYHAAFGVRYPFGKYDQLFVPEFKAGAMENAGAVTFLEDYVFRSRVTDAAREERAETILHEMAHMWFGDLVTMRWWDDLWLNESFATWASNVALAENTRWSQAWTTFAQAAKAWAYRQDQLPSTHPISADIPDIAAVEVNFDGITYAKGAAVLKQLVAYVGRDNFLAGVRSYFGRHAWANATLGDLLAAVQQASGRDLVTWSKLWLETAGVNTLRPDLQASADGTITSLAVVQEAPQAHPVLRPHRIAIGIYDLTDAGLVRRHRVETDIDGPRTEVPALAGHHRGDLVLVNDDDLSYAKIRLDARSLETLRSSIGEFTDSLPAALCWAAAWDMCRDAELAARDYARLALSGLDSIGDISVLETVLRQAAMAVRRYASPDWRAEGIAEMAAAVRRLLEAAEPGSDRQLAYARALAGVAVSRSDLDLIGGLLAGSAAVEGLVIDTDLRWDLLHRLVSRGVAGPAEIGAELARDATDAGERNAASCRAAIPEAAAKEAAWAEITSGSLGNAMFRAMLTGFADADQDELLAPYAARYFDVVGEIWRDWSSDMAQFFAIRAFPAQQVSAGTLAAADAYLERDGTPGALARLITEGRDDLARALRCRERDSGG